MYRRFPILWYFPVLLIIYCYGCKENKPGFDSDYEIINEVVKGAKNPVYPNLRSYSGNRNHLPIGIFDSGTGGLTVLNTILELDEFDNLTKLPGGDGIPDFADEKFIYLADEANMPYGKYDSEGKADFLRELVLKDVIFLLGDQYDILNNKRYKHKRKDPVKSIVIACNTATAYGLETARDAMEYWDLGVNILGIIEAGSKAAINIINLLDRDNSVIGILATEGTCSAGAYPSAVLKFAKEAIPGRQINTVQQAGIGLAGAIDGDINYIDPAAFKLRRDDEYYGPGIGNDKFPIDTALWKEYNFITDNGLLIELGAEGYIERIQLNCVDNYIKYMITHLVQNILRDIPNGSLDAVILGCTHYPYVLDEIRSHLEYLKNLDEKYKHIIPENTHFIDPAKSLAAGLYEELIRSELFGNTDPQNSQFFISVSNPFLEVNIINSDGEFPYEWKYGRDINQNLLYVMRVPFSSKWISQSVLDRIREDLPRTFEIMSPLK